MSKLACILMMFLVISCSGKNELGKCIGIVDEGKPELIYELDFRNTVWSFIGIETIVAPVLWATDYAKCPVRKREIIK